MHRPGIKPGTPGSVIERHNYEAKRSGPVRLVNIMGPIYSHRYRLFALRFAALLHIYLKILLVISAGDIIYNSQEEIFPLEHNHAE